MIWFAAGAFAAGAALGAGVVTVSRAVKRLTGRFEPDELHWAKTGDGWELPVGRYLPKGPRAVAEPVILCHGFGSNRFNLDYDETYSVARYLAARGFETMVVELRGCGISRRTDRGRFHDFCFDDCVKSDVPALIAKAKELAGTPRVLWVGHSKGGIVMYGFCGSGAREADLAGVVAIGSPLIGEGYLDERTRRILLAGSRFLFLDAIHVQPVLSVLAPLGELGLLKTRYLAVAENLDRTIAAGLLVNVVGNVSSCEAKQFARWIETGRFTSLDGKVDYRRGLERSRVPFLLVAGAADRLGPPESLEGARDAMRAASEEGLVDYLLCGTSSGYSCDYGHGDLVFGRDAPKEIFPQLESWLRRRGTPVKTASAA